MQRIVNVGSKANSLVKYSLFLKRLPTGGKFGLWWASWTHRKGQVEGRTLITTWSLMCEITSAQQGLLLRYKGRVDLYWFAEQVTSEIGMASLCPHIFERLVSKAVASLLSCYKNSCKAPRKTLRRWDTRSVWKPKSTASSISMF